MQPRIILSSKMHCKACTNFWNFFGAKETQDVASRYGLPHRQVPAPCPPSLVPLPMAQGGTRPPRRRPHHGGVFTPKKKRPDGALDLAALASSPRITTWCHRASCHLLAAWQHALIAATSQPPRAGEGPSPWRSLPRHGQAGDAVCGTGLLTAQLPVDTPRGPPTPRDRSAAYSTVTLLARLRGLSTSVPRATAVW